MTFPGGGESVGEAYIRIHADGSGLPRSIREEWAKTGPEFEDAGANNSKAFQKGWDDEGKKRPPWAKSINDMEHSKGRWQRVGRELGGAYGDSMRDEIIKRVGSKEIGDRIFRNLSEAARRNGNFAPFAQGIKNLGREISRATDQIAADEARLGRIQDQAQKENRQRDQRTLADARRLVDQLGGLASKRQALISKLSSGVGARDEKSLLSQLDSIRERIGNNDTSVIHDITRLRTETDNIIREGERGFLRLDGRTRASVREMSVFERRIQSVHNSVSKLDLGRIFGKGSRNNFINALGSVVGLLGQLAVKAALFIPESFGHLAADLRAAGTAGGKLNVILNRLGSVLFSGVKLMGVFAGAVGALQLILGPLAAAVSMLAGVVVALASSISFALIGAAAALLPILGALVIGVGSVALAFVKLSKDQKAALKADLKPLTSSFREFQEAVRKPLFANLGPQMRVGAAIVRRELIPLGAIAGRAASQFITEFESFMQSPAFRGFLDDFRSFLPGALHDLGRSFINIFGIITGLMHAALPVATQMITAIEDGSSRTSKWINSLRGQRVLTQWFEDGWTSARKLWRLLRDIVKVFGDIIHAGRGTGDNLIDSLSRQLERFDRFLTSGRGQRALASWFSDVERFWGFLGRALGGLGQLFGGLDNAESRQALNSILGFIGDLGHLVSQVLPEVSQVEHEVFGLVAQVADAAVKALQPLAPLFADIVRDGGAMIVAVLRPVAALAVGILEQLANLASFMSRHQAIFQPLIEGVLLLWAAFKGFTILNTVFTALTLLPTRIGLMNIALRARLAALAVTMSTGVGRLSTAALGLGLIAGANGIGNAAGPQGSTRNGLATLGANAGGGALIGASVGSLIPVVGTATGAAVGGTIGTIRGLINVLHQVPKAVDTSKQDFIDAMNAQNAAAQTLLGTLQSVNGALNDQVRGNVTQQLASSGALGIAKDAGVDLSSLVDTVTGAADPATIERVNTQLDLAAIKGKITEAQYNQLKKALVAVGAGAAQAESEVNLQNEAMRKSGLSAGELGTSMRKLRSAFSGSGKDITTNTAAAQRNRAILIANVQAINANVASQLKHGKSVRDVATYLENQIGALDTNASAITGNKKGVEALITQYAKMPRSVITELVKRGVLPADIQQIIDKYKNLPSTVVSNVSARDAASPVVATILAKLKTVPASKRTAVTLAAAKAIEDLEHIRELMGDIRQSSSTTISVSGSGRFASTGAHGMILTGAKRLLAGEAGPEALVPLRRPLSQVDPAVKALSAFAQGIPFDGNEPHMARGGIVTGGRTVQVESGAITVIDNSGNPRATAVQTLNELVARVAR